MTDKTKSNYSKTWDNYVINVFPEIKRGRPYEKSKLKSWQVLNTEDAEYVWAGDEWGTVNAVRRIAQTCIFDFLDVEPKHLCELGSGAGRYTKLILDKFSDVKVYAFDVSELFIDQINKRFQEEISGGQLQSYLLTNDPRCFYDTVDQSGLVGQIDAIYSFDAMVHVELHTLLIYVATASAILKRNGLLAMSVADATSDFGFQKLVHDSPGVFQRGGNAGAHFQFIAPEIIGLLLDRFGFSYEFHNCNDRDLFLTARLDEPGAAQQQFNGSGSKWWCSK